MNQVISKIVIDNTGKPQFVTETIKLPVGAVLLIDEYNPIDYTHTLQYRANQIAKQLLNGEIN
jgi:hypothetical protein